MAAPEHLCRRDRVSVFNDHLAVTTNDLPDREAPGRAAVA